MNVNIVCPNVDDGCDWSETPNELEDHMKSCPCRQSKCMYCHSVLPYNQMAEHSDICMNTRLQEMLQMEEAAFISFHSQQEPKEEIFMCPNADKLCTWYGPESKIKDHLKSCLCRQSTCLYCQSVFPYNQMAEHSDICMSTRLQEMLQMEESAFVSFHSLQEPKEEIFMCPNADKLCIWYGPASKIEDHLFNCEMEKDVCPTSIKKRRIE